MEVLSLHVYLKWLTTFDEDLLACLQELVNSHHSVIVPVHFLENVTHSDRCLKGQLQDTVEFS